MKRARGGEGGGQAERELLARLGEALSDEEMRRVLVGALLTVEGAGGRRGGSRDPRASGALPSSSTPSAPRAQDVVI